MVNAAEATDVKIREECQPGKPIPVFSETAHKVADVCLYYGSASLLRHIIVEVMTFETFCSWLLPRYFRLLSLSVSIPDIIMCR